MRFFALLIIALSFPVTFSQAQTPVPSAHPVKEMETKIKSQQQKQEDLKQEIKDIKSGLEQKKKEMVGVAKKIKQNEQKLTNLEQRIEVKEQEQLAIEVRLGQDREAISDLVLAMERMRRIPPEALLARPGAPLETAQSAMLLQSVLPRVNNRAESLKKDITQLSSIIEDLKQDRATVMQTSKKLESDRTQLAGLLSQREKLYSKTTENIEAQKKELNIISRQAKNLRDLVARIEKRQQEANARREAAEKQAQAQNVAVQSPLRSIQTPMPKAGEAQLPISGLIRVGYGNSDNIGAVSQGLKIEGRENALVVAPMGGVVDYAGAFKGYGQIIIIKHQKGYHSLVAGLGKIDTVVGRAVAAGEPIGKMAAKRDNQAPMLYYELRYKGNPVNPSKKIAGLR